MKASKLTLAILLAAAILLQACGASNELSSTQSTLEAQEARIGELENQLSAAQAQAANAGRNRDSEQATAGSAADQAVSSATENEAVDEAEILVLGNGVAVGTLCVIDRKPGQLSGGQCQRVGIARAIVTDPTIVVADEPTGALDAKSAETALSLLEILRGELGKTIIMVTHDPHAAAKAQRIVHLEKGRLVDADAEHPIPTLARAGMESA